MMIAVAVQWRHIENYFNLFLNDNRKLSLACDQFVISINLQNFQKIIQNRSREYVVAQLVLITQNSFINKFFERCSPPYHHFELSLLSISCLATAEQVSTIHFARTHFIVQSLIDSKCCRMFKQLSKCLLKYLQNY